MTDKTNNETKVSTAAITPDSSITITNSHNQHTQKMF